MCPLGLATMGLATYIGFSDLNRVDENWSLNPAGTVLSPFKYIMLYSYSFKNMFTLQSIPNQLVKGQAGLKKLTNDLLM